MSGIGFVARAHVRRHRASLVALGVLVAILGGIALGAGAGARRTATAYDRLLDRASADTVALAAGGAGVGFNYELDVREVAAFPEVERAAIMDVFFFGARTEDGVEVPNSQWALIAGERTFTEAGVNVPKVLDGRLADPTRADEVEVGFAWAAEYGVEVGDTVTIDLLDPRAIEDFNTGLFLPPIATVPAEVVGIVAAPGTFPPKEIFWQVFATPAFRDRYVDVAASVEGLMVILEDEGPALASFKQRIDRLAGGAQQFLLQRETTVGVVRSMRLLGVAMALFAAMIVVALILFTAQSLARQFSMGSHENVTLASLGVTRSERFRAALAVATFVVGAGVAGAAAIAYAISWRMPIGVARLAEPAEGLAFDALVLLGGGAFIVVAILAILVAPVWAVTAVRRGPDRGRAAGQRRPSRVAAILARAGAAPSTVAGARLALERGRGRTAVPVWTTLVTSATGMAALVMALTFSASTTHLLDSPRLFGWNWDFVAGNIYGPDTSEWALPRLRSDDAVAAFSAGTTNLRLGVEDARGIIQSVNVMALDLVDGEVTPTMIQGRWPRARDEIALATSSMRAIGASVGSTVTAVVGEGAEALRKELTVVGRPVMPSLNDPNLPDLGEGAGMTFAGIRDFIPGAFMNLFPIRYASTAAPEKIEQIQSDFPATQLAEVLARPSLLDTLDDTGATPLLIAIVLVALAAATLTHGVMTAVARRRRDLATLKSLGFDRRQVRAAVTWHAGIASLLAALIALPIGGVGGRLMWRAFAEQVGFLSETILPLATLVLVVPGAVVLGIAVSLVPGRVAARSPAAVVLREE